MPNPPPPHWTPDEREVFSRLTGGREFDAAAARNVPPAPRGTRNLPLRVSGSFLSEVARKHMDELPMGVQLRGVLVEGAIDFENVRAEKMISLDECYLEGPIIARNSKFITFSLEGSTLEREMDMRSATVDGPIFLRDGFESKTFVLLRDVVVKGPVDCSRAIFRFNSKAATDLLKDAAGESFSLARSTTSALFWRDMPVAPEGRVNLRDCRIGSFRDHIESLADVERDWPEPGNLRMSGLKYEARTSTNPEPLLAWIGLQDTTENRYGSYQAAINVLLENGHQLSADRLILDKQRFIAEHDTNILNKFLRNFYIVLTDAGINTQKAVLITIALFFVGWVGIGLEEQRGGFAPKSSEIVKDNCYDPKRSCAGWVTYGDHRIPSYYPKFSAFGYTVDLFVPGVNYGTSADWRPATSESSAVTLAIRIAGIISSALVLLCLSGIARFWH
jgi:hypothetical protein